MTTKQNQHTPGPIGTSCLTCKHRRKKCDRGRPACETCINSDYDCLGYAHLGQNPPSSGSRISTLPSCVGEENPDFYPMEPSYTMFPNLPITHLLTPAALPHGPTTSAFGFANGYDNISFLPQFGMINGFDHSSCNGDHDVYACAAPYGPADLVSSWEDLSSTPLDSAFSAISRQSAAPYFASSRMSSAWEYPQSYIFSIPPTLSPVSSDVAQATQLIISQQEKMIKFSYYEPSRQQIACVRNLMISRLQSSSEIRSTMLLGFRILQSVLDGTSAQNFPRYRRWLERFEERLYSTSDQHRSPAESQSRLSGKLEAAFLKLKVSDNGNMYQLLRSSVGIFLQIAQAEGALQPSTCLPLVSLAGIFATMRHELAHFVVLDSMCSMLYALPQVVEYDTSVLYSDFHPVEWSHGCPIEFQTVLVDINMLFNHRQIATELDWRRIEHRIKSWQPIIKNSSDDKSWKTVARLAVQESWRHTLLVYLYMAIVDVSSHDARVQASVRQIFQLIGTVKAQPLSNFYCLTQHLVAGACTRSEKHRALARERLGSQSHNKSWLLHGVDFIPVLDHLWHGAAADGRPIRWRDYVHSRRIAYPISV